MNLQHKIAIVTGACAEIGAETAKLLAHLGAQVVLVGDDKKKLNELATTIKQESNSDAYIMKGRITDDKFLKKVVKKTLEKFKKIDILINSAVDEKHATCDDDLSTFDRLWATNVRSAFILTKLVRDSLLATDGNIINISSMASKVVYKGCPMYSVVKEGLDSFTKNAAADMKPIRINSVNPGYIDTAALRENFSSDEIGRMKNLNPLGRLGLPIDVAYMVAFLASDLASYTSGTHVLVDGGTAVGGNINLIVENELAVLYESRKKQMKTPIVLPICTVKEYIQKLFGNCLSITK